MIIKQICTEMHGVVNDVPSEIHSFKNKFLKGYTTTLSTAIQSGYQKDKIS